MIPARYGATRFPAKLMQDLCGAPVIVRTYEAVVRTELFEEVYVVTDDDRIAQVIEAAGGSVIRSQKEHNSGSDRLAEASENLNVDIIVNVQGDEPFTAKENLQKLIAIFREDSERNVSVASVLQTYRYLCLPKGGFARIYTFTCFFIRRGRKIGAAEVFREWL